MRSAFISTDGNFDHWRLRLLRTGMILLIVLISCGRSSAYSVLTHEEIVDLLWTAEIRPLLLKRYPGLSEDQIREAHAYAYGGAVIQDLGYYPFGSSEFSDLVHYVRSGDFVQELLLESHDVNEYAFALGALSHYAADIAGHPAVNEAVAIQYPKLRAKFGKSVRYAQDKTAHLKTEFGFDTVQVAKNRYAKLLAQLSGRKFDLTSTALRANILEFYSDLSIPIETKKDQARWNNVLISLDQLRLLTPAPVVASGSTK
jgi:hypothetical protein